jgi:hypothetical protein
MEHHPRVLHPRQVRSGPKPLSHAPEAITAPSAYPRRTAAKKALARENQGNLAPAKTGAVFLSGVTVSFCEQRVFVRRALRAGPDYRIALPFCDRVEVGHHFSKEAIQFTNEPSHLCANYLFCRCRRRRLQMPDKPLMEHGHNQRGLGRPHPCIQFLSFPHRKMNIGLNLSYRTIFVVY